MEEEEDPYNNRARPIYLLVDIIGRYWSIKVICFDSIDGYVV